MTIRTAPDGGSAVGIWGPEYDDGLTPCAHCGEAIEEANVEAFELSGDLVCDDCAEAIFEDNSQFGVGA